MHELISTLLFSIILHGSELYDVLMQSFQDPLPPVCRSKTNKPPAHSQHMSTWVYWSWSDYQVIRQLGTSMLLVGSWEIIDILQFDCVGHAFERCYLSQQTP
ncbi:hypothetical protein GQ43DRAFT_453121 [Delitschia confertaspora ATCC 74209]|uniref:Uncharacterized protein n=1 Tax=Delitschia confertaspora ATCC 74209 TaxID=1513339 RepID=A0A9P4JUL9_9PLEO|nr:hypothetical protein GQ43DRAFT_453121 [Delitschia confertaspora ATCC 74209]